MNNTDATDSLRAVGTDSIKSVGAGGIWEVINERVDPSVVRQQTNLSCASAVGEMLLRRRGIDLTQGEIIAKIGQPASVQQLAGFLNEVEPSLAGEKWHGLFVSPHDFRALSLAGTWGAVLREGTPLGHLVLVEGLTAQGLIAIKDPFDGTAYEMTEAEFLKHWGGEAVFRWKF